MGTKHNLQPESTENNSPISALNIIEPVILFIIIYVFWFHSPNYRDSYVWLLILALPIFRERVVAYQRVWTQTPLNYVLIGFILLTIFNFVFAPYSRANYFVLLSRPFLGIWLYLYFLENARVFKSLKYLVIATISMGFALGIISLTTTNFELGKSGDLLFIINAIPRFDWRVINWPTNWVEWMNPALVRFGLPALSLPPVSAMLLGFNPNEVAGALSWIIPPLAAFTIGNPLDEEASLIQKRLWLAIRIASGIAFAIAMLSLFLGQSRFALAGVFGALIITFALLVKNRLMKIIGLAGVGVIILLQLAVFFNVFASNPASDSVGVSARDQNTLSTRFDLWDSAARMMFDYPLTGTGMSMFRAAVNQDPYRIQYYINLGTTPPHAHNEWLQIGADLGVVGFLMYLTMQAIVLWMLWKGWSNHEGYGQIVVVAVFGGLLAHGVYGLGDAVTLWDRFSFILWWLVGLAGAQYVLIPLDKSKPET